MISFLDDEGLEVIFSPMSSSVGLSACTSKLIVNSVDVGVASCE